MSFARMSMLLSASDMFNNNSETFTTDVETSDNAVTTDASHNMTYEYDVTLQLEETVSVLRDGFNSLQIILGLAIIAVNAAILWLFARHDFLKSKPNVYIMNQSLGDLMCGITSVYTGITNFYRYSARAEVACVMAGVLQTITFGMSLICMAGVAGASYVKIAHPYVHQRWVEKH